MAIWGPVLAAAVVYAVANALDQNRSITRTVGGLLILGTSAIAAVQVLALVLL